MALREQLDSLAKDLGLTGPGEAADYPRLLEFWNEGVCLIAEQRPDLFTQAMVIKLDPGTIQELDCCRAVGKVFGQSDERGNLLKHVTAASAALADRWIGTTFSCPPKGPYRIRSITRSGQAKGQFIVEPPVPPNEKVYLLTNCSTGAKHYRLADLELDLQDVDCGSSVAVKQWVIFRVLFGDGAGDELTTRRAGTALRLFFSLIKVKLQAELLYELGIVPIGKGQQLLNTGTGQVA